MKFHKSLSNGNQVVPYGQAIQLYAWTWQS